jgi:class 3 adenylate cyclase
MSRVIRCFQGFVTKRTESSGVVPGESAELREGEAESRVGRKLSELTTVRVIVLVLVMLVVVPQLQQSDFTVMMDPGAQYGANVLLEAWRQYELTALESPQAAALLDQRRWEWELEMLTYIYYHNWHAAECPANSVCASDWLDKLCWIGFVHRSDTVLDSVDVTSQAYIKAIAESGADWDSLLADSDPDRRMDYVVGSLPESVKAALSRPWDAACDEAGSSSRVQGVSLIPGLPCPRQELRKQETLWYVPQVYDKAFFVDHMEAQFVLVYDLRGYVRAEANFNILQTAFVVLVLGIAALLFSRDVDRLVLHPIEKMIRKVEIIRKDPLYAIKLADLEPGEREEDNRTRSLSFVSWPWWRRLPGWPRSRRADDEGTPKSSASSGRRSKSSASSRRSLKKATSKERSMETKILENAIIKLGSLLALGFGEAGVEIIGQNLDDENATVDAMIPGSKVEGIYGWCDIRNFAVVTEVLQGKTMVFVNQVAEIVHRIVDEHLGAANKNAGQAFLMVWRLEDHLPTGGSSGPGPSSREMISDLAVMSFVRVVMELARNSSLAEYQTHPWLLAKLPKFRVRLGFGLHLGWSIEGAIGSAFKIDASYLSPHVNVAVQLEEMTMEYDVKILMSEPLVRSCNPRFSRHFRPVDRVQLPGSKTIARLFTVDLDDTTLRVETRRRALKARRSQRRQDREIEKQKMLHIEQDFAFENDRFIMQMRRQHTQQFFQEYERGYLNYEAGEWDVACEALRRTMFLPRRVTAHFDRQQQLDGPSNVLLTYMGKHGFEAPDDWKGWRKLAREAETIAV